MGEKESHEAAREAMREVTGHLERQEGYQHQLQRYLSAAAYHAKQAEILVERAQTGPRTPHPAAQVRTWSVEISIDERGDQPVTRAEARLTSAGKARLTGEGLARRSAADSAVPEVGDELAVARALADLSHQLMESAAEDLQHFAGSG